MSASNAPRLKHAIAFSQQTLSFLFADVLDQVLRENCRATPVPKWKPTPDIPNYLHFRAASMVDIDPAFHRPVPAAQIQAQVLLRQIGKERLRTLSCAPIVIRTRNPVRCLTAKSSLKKRSDARFHQGLSCKPVLFAAVFTVYPGLALVSH